MTMVRKQLNLTLFALLLFALFGLRAWAVPARPGSFELRQPDGTVLTVSLHGDEHFHYYTTADGFPLLPGSDGCLRYVTLSGRRVEVSDVRAHEPAARSAAEKSFVAGLDLDAVKSGLGQMRAELRAAHVQAKSGLSDMMTDYPTTGSPKALILLVEFGDVKFATENAGEEFTKLMTEPGYSYNGATGSALDYFTDNSNGKFKPEFVVCGPVTLPREMAYYGAPTANMYDARPGEMIADGCRILDETTDVDFSQFDNDGDGIVDNVFVFYAGYGQNSGASVNTIWPHAANILTYYNIKLELDGVQIGNYACTNELQGNSGEVRTGIGTFCHEFSHVLGLPDLYPTDNSGGFTPGAFELMDTGPYNNNGNTPPYMSAFDRMSLRWLNPRELTGPETVTLDDITSDQAYLIRTIADNEYYLLENRQQRGWDAYIPGHGMLVWHIDYDAEVWQKNQVNNSPSHQRVDLVEADNMPTDITRSGDPFPGTNNVTAFTSETTPAMTSWTSVRIDMPLTDIREQDGIITFKADGGGDRIDPVTALEAEEVAPTSFRARWEGRVSVNKYEVDLFRGVEVVPATTLVKETKSTADCYADFDGLQPSTDYRYVVRAVDGNLRSSDSNPIAVRTADPTFDMLAVEAAEAVDVERGGFTARWQPLEGADDYELSVYTKRYVEPEHDVVDFADDLNLPDGWTTTCTSTSGVAGTFGQARPSLRMFSTGDLITSPEYGADINALTFWMCGSKDVAGTLKVEQQIAGAWQEMASLGLQAGAQTVAFGPDTAQPLAAGCRRVRLMLERQAGSLYIDDVDVAYNGAELPVYVDGYERRGTEGATSCKVEGLVPATAYFFSVTGVKDGVRSLPSGEVAVTTQTGIRLGAVAENGVTVRVCGLGAEVANATAESVPVNVWTPGGTEVYSSMVRPSSSLRIPLGTEGVYIIKVSGKVVKIVI